MKVLWLAATPPPSKTGDHPTPWVTALANSLVGGGDVSIDVISYNTKIQADEEVVRNGIKYTFLKVLDDKWDLLRGYSQRIKVVKDYLRGLKGQYDLMHIHGAEQQYHVMGTALDIPKVLSAQGFVTEYYKHLPQRPDYRHLSWLIAGYYERQYMSTVQHFICRTHWDKSFIQNLNKQSIIHHNWEMIRPEFYEAIQPPVDPARNAVLFVGGTNLIKGIRETLQVMDALRGTLPIRLIVTGGGSKAELLQMAAALGLKNLKEEDIEHRGMLNASQLWEVYHEAFCLFHPSYIDNSPNSVCEAQLAGLPVIASNVGGVASLVENFETGLLTSLKVPDLIGAVRELWTNPDLRWTLIHQAREISLQRFDRETIKETTKSIYQQVLASA